MYSVKDISEYIVALIAAFASRYDMTDMEAYKYLSRYGAIKVVAKTEHSHPLGMVVSTHFRCGKGVKRGLKNGALPFTSYEGV